MGRWYRVEHAETLTMVKLAIKDTKTLSEPNKEKIYIILRKVFNQIMRDEELAEQDYNHETGKITGTFKRLFGFEE